jgi:hypothetical protein
MSWIKRMDFDAQGRFKILQVADLHFFELDTPSNNWTEPLPDGGRKTIDFIDRVLAEERPDLVVFTGDNTTINPTRPALDIIFRVCQDRETPFAVILGNHEGMDFVLVAALLQRTAGDFDLSREETMQHCVDAPFSVSAMGPPELSGYGNYLIDLCSPDTRMRLVFLDSHDNIAISKAYDFLKPDQIAFFREHTSLDLPSLLFLHIPPPQVNLMCDRALLKAPLPDEVPFERVGSNFERSEPSPVDSGIYEAMREQGWCVVLLGF